MKSKIFSHPWRRSQTKPPISDKTTFDQSRRNNLRIEGVHEEKRERWSKTEQKVVEALVTELNLDFTAD